MEHQPVEEFSIDWEWYDEMVLEYEQMVEEEKRNRESLLIDFDEPIKATKSKDNKPSTNKKYMDELESIFSYHN